MAQSSRDLLRAKNKANKVNRAQVQSTSGNIVDTLIEQESAELTQTQADPTPVEVVKQEVKKETTKKTTSSKTKKETSTPATTKKAMKKVAKKDNRKSVRVNYMITEEALANIEKGAEMTGRTKNDFVNEIFQNLFDYIDFEN